jgi:hypothetical protein
MIGKLRVRQAADARSRRAFLDLPCRLYADDPNWVPPLRSARAKLFAGKTAFFDHAEMALFLAERSGRAVGRVAAIHNTAHNAWHDDGVGFFGFFECECRDEDAAAALLDRAERWLAERGLDTLRGPVNPSMNSECGLLVEGFDRPPMVMMPYNPEAYAGLLEAHGLRKRKDLLAFRIVDDDLQPGTPLRRRMERTVNAIRRRHPEVDVRCLRMRQLETEVVRFLSVFEEARRNNWGYVPVTEREILETARDMKRVVDPEIVILAEMNGEPVGASLALPDVNRALAAAGGRMLPFGFLRFFRELKRTREIRILGIAALAEHRHRGITALLLTETMIRGMAKGYCFGEASWVLEDNAMSSRTIINTLGAERYKTYRIYDKPIARAPTAGR